MSMFSDLVRVVKETPKLNDVEKGVLLLKITDALEWDVDEDEIRDCYKYNNEVTNE